MFFYFTIPYFAIAQLPYSTNDFEYKSKSKDNAIVKIIDSLGYTYFGITDKLMNEELKISFESSKLKLLLENVYKASENIINSTSRNKPISKLKNINISFQEIRRNTLSNLVNARNNITKNKEAFLFLNLNALIESVSSAKDFCNEIIVYRENIGNPYKSKINLTNKSKKRSKLFDKSIGADGLTNNQWINIMKGGGSNAHDLIRRIGRENQKTLTELKKKERTATIEVGDIEKIRTTSNIIDNLIYKYSNLPPSQLSLLYTSDNELIKELVYWIVYINSGNFSKLSEILSPGLNTNTFIDFNLKKLQNSNSIIREIKDQNGNKIVLKLNKKHFEQGKFSDVIIKKVSIEKNQIIFYDNTNKANLLSEKIIVLKNLEGDLLERIKLNINLIRKGTNEYNDSIMYLSKY